MIRATLVNTQTDTQTDRQTDRHPCVCMCALASLYLLGPTCVRDQHYKDPWPYWDLI